MRKIAILTAFAALILSTATASAGNDFDALLGQIDFGATHENNGPSNGTTLTMDNIPVDTLAPAPTPEPLQAPVPDAAPQPISQPVANTHQPAAGSACDAAVTCDGRCAGGTCNGRCGHRRRLCGRDNSEEYCSECVPHTPPNLPTSSFREYFKSDSCNTRVWDGWQNRCGSCSKHSRGECDCFDPNKKRHFQGLGLGGIRRNIQSCNPKVYPAGNCEKSGAAGCLQLPSAWNIKGDCAGQADCAAAPACDSPGCAG